MISRCVLTRTDFFAWGSLKIIAVIVSWIYGLIEILIKRFIENDVLPGIYSMNISMYLLSTEISTFNDASTIFLKVDYLT